MLVSARISRLLDTCLSVIHNANYIVNSIVCAVILVRGSRVPEYGIRPMHGQIHIVNMHGTGTKHIVRHSQKSVVQWSVISKFTCTVKPQGCEHLGTRAKAFIFGELVSEVFSYCKRYKWDQGTVFTSLGQGLSRYLETGCPNRGFIYFCVSKVWYKVHTINKITLYI